MSSGSYGGIGGCRLVFFIGSVASAGDMAKTSLSVNFCVS